MGKLQAGVETFFFFLRNMETKDNVTIYVFTMFLKQEEKINMA